VWATYQRNPWLTGDVERMVYGTILNKAKELGGLIHQIGNTDDHIHVVASIPPKVTVAECVRHLKGASSHYVNEQAVIADHFGWQDGYGAITFGERSMERLVAYAKNQREHHAEGTTVPHYERTSEEKVSESP
jgi:REP element-mobilizing transposase RayT